MEERRQYIRYKIKGSVIFFPQDGTSRAIKAELLDICRIGISVLANECIDVESVVKFELLTNFWEGTVIGTGIIKYLGKVEKFDGEVFRFGVNFIEIDKNVIQGILRKAVEDVCKVARKRVG